MRAYNDPPLDYARSPRQQRKHYTNIAKSRPPLDKEMTKSSKKIMFLTNTFPMGQDNNYDKENVALNCKSTVNIVLPGESSSTRDAKGGKGTKKRSCSFLNKSQATYASSQPPSIPTSRYKAKSKWETTQYYKNYLQENYDPSINYDNPVIPTETQNNLLSPNNSYLQKVTKYKSQNTKPLYDYNENKTINYEIYSQETYPKFGNEGKQLKQQINQNSRSKKNIPLYERLKGYNDTGLNTQNQGYLYKSYSHNNNQFSQFGIAKKPLNDSIGGYKYKEIIDKYATNNTTTDSSYSARLKTEPQTLESSKKTTIKFFDQKQTKQPELDDFLIGQCKGEGRFGKVYMAVHKKTGFLCALKKIKKQSVKYMIDQFIQEVKIQLYLNHPKLLKIYGYFSDKQYFYMLIEYMEEGSLYSLMKKNKKFQEKEAAEKLNQICEGIKEMHNQNIVHRDLKPQNVVMSNGVCKICDFGWAAICEDRRQTYCGTLDYVCPEIVQGNAYDSSADIWCIGVLAYQLMCGKAPFYDISRQKTIQKIKSCKIDSYPPHLSRKAIRFIQMILKKNPDSRVGIQELLDSDFLRQVQK